MTTIGFMGSGRIGSTLARLSVAAGYDVVLSNSRGPHTLTALVDKLGPRARATTPAEAAAAGDIVVVSIPLGAYRSVPVAPTAGKIVIDTNNYYPERDGHIAELDNESTTTSELLQQHLPGARVVKAFNNIFYRHLLGLAKPAGAVDRSALAIAGDDSEAKASVAELLDRIGYDTVDAGPLAEGWRYQRETVAYAALYLGEGDNAWEAGRSVDSDGLRTALAQAKRYADMSSA